MSGLQADFNARQADFNAGNEIICFLFRRAPIAAAPGTTGNDRPHHFLRSNQA
jgi:hypothetical protein